VLAAFPSRELSVQEAIQTFERIPGQWQLASLHPGMVDVDAARDPLIRPVFWYFQKDGHYWVHCFQLVDNPELEVRDIQSAYGYGGPLSDTDDPGFLKEAQDAFARWAEDNDVIAEFLRFHPLVPHERWYAGQVANNRETVHIDLGTELFEQYQGRRRTDVRRFLKSRLKVERVSPDVMSGAFPELYKQNMDQIGAAKSYYFSARYFEALFRFAGVENWLAYSGDTAIAGAVVLVSNTARIAEYFLGAKTVGFEEHKPMIGLLHVVAHHYQELAFRYFFLGGGRSTDPNDSLLTFKKGFSPLTGQYRIGSRVLDRESYARLAALWPKKAQSGRVLFYKD
jgi:hypothetical protein